LHNDSGDSDVDRNPEKKKKKKSDNLSMTLDAGQPHNINKEKKDIYKIDGGEKKIAGWGDLALLRKKTIHKQKS